MGASEKLGIQLHIEPPKDDATAFLTKLSADIQSISKALAGVDLSKVAKGGDAAEKAATAAAKATKNLAKETEEATKKAEALARGIVPTGNNWAVFEKANRDAAKAMTTNWQDAQKLMSDSFKKFNAERIIEAEKTEKAVRSSLAETVKTEEQNNRVRATIKRRGQELDDQELSSKIRNAEKQKDVWAKFNAAMDKEEAAKAKKQTSVNMQGLSAFTGYLDGQQKIQQTSLRSYSQYLDQQAALAENASKRLTSINMRSMRALSAYQAEQQQSSWNQQAGTQGVKYQPVDNGFVRASVQTQNLDSSAMGRIRTEAEGIHAAFKKTNGEANVFHSLLGNMVTRLAEFYSLRTIMFAIGNQFRDATRSAIDMNQAVHDIIAISGGASSEFNGISESIYAIAKSSRFTANEVASLMQVLAQAGIKTNELGRVSDVVGKFATATASDPKLAADVVTTAMNTFKIGANDVTRVTNAMTAALNLSKLETAGLSTAFNYLAPQAAQLGISMEQTLGVIATMAQSGIKASTIGTGVSQMLKEFAAPKKRLKDMLSSHDMTTDDINPMKREISDIIQTLQDKKVTVDELFQAMETRVGRAAVTMINLGAPALREMTASLTGTQAALVAYSETMDGAKARMNVVKQTFQETAGLIGQHLAPVLIQLTESLRGFATGLGAADGKMATFGISAVALSAGLFAAYKAAGMIALSLNLIGANAVSASVAFTTLITTMKGLSLASLAGPQVIITGILLAVGGAFYLLGKWLDRKKEKEEEANKVTLESIANGERLDRTLNSMAHSNGKVSEAYTKYYALIKAGKSEEEALKVLKGTNIKVTEDQIKALNDYIRSGGPHAKYLEGLSLEKIALSDIIKLEKERRGSSNTTLESDALEYTTKRNELRRNRANRLEVRDRESLSEGGFGMFNPASDAQKKEIHRLNIIAEDKAEQAQLQPLYNKVNGQVFKDPITGQATQVPRFTNNGDLYYDKVVAPEKPTPGKPRNTIDKVTSEEKQSVRDSNERLRQADVLEKARIEQIRADIKTQEDIINNDKSTHEERQKALTVATALIKKEAVAIKAENFLSEHKSMASTEGVKYLPPSEKHPNGVWEDSPGRGGVVRSEEFDSLEQGLLKVIKTFSDKADTVAENKIKALGLKAEKKDDAQDKTKAPNTLGAIKSADRDLAMENRTIALQKAKVWTAQEVYKLDEQQAANEVKNSETKKTAYETEAKYLGDKRIKLVAEHKDLKDIDAQINTNNEAHQATVDLLKEQKQKLDDIKNANPWTSFADGAKEAFRVQSDINAQSKQLGSNITNTGINGISDSIFTALNPDQQKIAETKAKITELNVQKAELEDSIRSSSLNTNRTAEESNSLNEKKVALDGINSSLKTQQDSLSKQTNAWQNFADGLKKVMVQILEELQKYIIKLMVVKMFEMAIGMFVDAPATAGVTDLSKGYDNMLTGTSQSYPVSITPAGATGGLFSGTAFKHYAEGGMTDATAGGFVPKLPGTQWGVDGVHAIVAPGEVVIKRSSVQAIGSDRLLYANEHGKLPAFANGGMVGGSSPTKSTEAKQEFTLQIVNVLPGEKVPDPGEQATQIINVITNDMMTRGPSFRAVREITRG